MKPPHEGSDRAVLDRNHVIEYVGGAWPYFWIGSKDGTYYDSITAADLYDLVDRVRAETAAAR